MNQKRDWSWMRQHMPAVIVLIQREREAGHGALIDECWRRGVIGGEPGWFYAHQNGCSVGVPPAEYLRDPNQAAIRAMFPEAAVLMLKGRMAEGA